MKFCIAVANYFYTQILLCENINYSTVLSIRMLYKK
nr:MAG TPA: hypothetical protein [Caudoviricetes sp.]